LHLTRIAEDCGEYTKNVINYLKEST